MQMDSSAGTSVEDYNYDRNKFHAVLVKKDRGSDTFIVPKRYTKLMCIGAGAQGTVVRAYDEVAKEQVAIKKVLHPFQTPMNAKRTYREFVLLATMKHPNLITLKSAYSPQTSLETFNDIYLVMEFMDSNLAQVIEKMKLDHRNISYFVYQMIVAVKYMHRSGFIHRDLKPSNITINKNCILKILDFGLARKKEDHGMSIYVVTRFYRAPEVILGLPYDEKVDIWSIGCILAEMILQKVLFPGTDYLHQWNEITNILGTPDETFIKKLSEGAKRYVLANRRCEAKPFEKIFPDSAFIGHYPKAPQLCAENARDLLSKMLQIDPERRISIDEAVKHPYVNLWFDGSEWNAPLPTNRYDPNNDFIERDINEWKRLVFNEVKQYEQTHNIFDSQLTETVC